jgi:hypothetical protein
MMDVPVRDEHALTAECLAGVVRADGDVAEETEAHGAIVESVVPWWTDGAEASWILTAEREVDGVEHATGGGACGVPGAFAGHRVRVEAATSGGGGAYRFDVGRVVRERQLFDSRVTPFEVLDGLEEINVVPERSRDGA